MLEVVEAGSSRTPWRCAACGHDARAQSIGEACTECGGLLGEGSMRPAWLTEGKLRSMRRLALAGALLGIPTVFVCTALFLPKGVVPASAGLSVAWTLFGCAAVGLIAQAAIGSTLASVGLEGRRARGMRLAGWARPAGLVVIAGMVLGIDPLERALPEGLRAFIGLSWFGVYLATVALIAAADIVLMVRFGRLRRSLAMVTTGWHTAGFVLRVLLLAPTYLLAMFPFFGWTMAPIAWNALAVLTFAALWWDLSVAQRRGL